MEGFFNSALPLWQKYKGEVILTLLAVIIALTSALIYIKNNRSFNTEQEILTEEKPAQLSTTIVAEINGAVNNPGVYEVTAGARLKDLINLAEGLSDEAEKNYFARNFNLARFVSDQEKIYVPHSWEVESGIFTETQRTLNYISQIDINRETEIQTSIIDINDATLEELDTLPGIGKITAQKIIDNRPYQTIEELLTKKVVNKTVFEKIKNLIQL